MTLDATTYPMTLRRLRQNPTRRRLFANTHISAAQLIQPYFVYQGLRESQPLASLHGQEQHCLDSLCRRIEYGLERGISSVMLFFVPEKKATHDFDFSFDADVLSKVKAKFGDSLNLLVDVCLCSNTASGHCGIINSQGHIDNAGSVLELARKAKIYASAGADGVCPSDMMDDRIAAIRSTLDDSQLSNTLIVSYSSKFSSAFYGPFRAAAKSTPSSGDRKSYQLDPANSREGLRAARRDAAQGADVLMVKPGLAYLDIIYQIKHDPELAHIPLCAYQVSGEYESLQLGAKHGLFHFATAYLETLIALRRAGSDMIITYGANDFTSLFGTSI